MTARPSGPSSHASEQLDVRRAEVLAALGVLPTADATAARAHRGRVLAWHVDGDEVQLRTELTGLDVFTERLRIATPDGTPLTPDPADPSVAGALDLLALAAATSYLKATLPAIVELAGRSVGPAAHALMAALITDGLAEHAFTNGLTTLEGQVHVVDAAAGADRAAGAAATGAISTVPVRDGILVTVGGGKDSALTLALAHRNDPDVLALAVNPRAPMERTAQGVGVGMVRIERRIDPRLLTLNARGAFNGHVPITAIVMAAAVLAAAMLGRGSVLVANEASADEPTRTVDGWAINHQFSKSSRYEALLSAALVEAGTGVRVVSLLRPLGELAVARAVARTPGLVASITSCNAAYAMGATSDAWCGDCPKCRFVQLALAPFAPRDELTAALGFDALGDAAQIGGFATMLDPATKPFECVGTVDEVRLALDLLAADPAWQDAPAVAALRGGDARRAADAPASAAELQARLREALRPDSARPLPPPFERWLEDPELIP